MELDLELSLASNFDSCMHCGSVVDGTRVDCSNCGGRIITTDLLYLNQLERLVSELFGATVEAGLPLDLDDVSEEERDPFMTAVVNLLQELRIYHWHGDGCCSQSASE
jgi:hypothetical protein